MEQVQEKTAELGYEIVETMAEPQAKHSNLAKVAGVGLAIGAGVILWKKVGRPLMQKGRAALQARKERKTSAKEQGPKVIDINAKA
jgi:4-aminobutyrate aminotransferase-like enzyme